MIIKDSNVGIGTTSPGQKLDVSGNIAATGSITSGATFTSNAETTLFQGATNTHLRAETGQILLVANGGERMRIDSNGNISTSIFYFNIGNFFRVGVNLKNT